MTSGSELSRRAVLTRGAVLGGVALLGPGVTADDAAAQPPVGADVPTESAIRVAPGDVRYPGLTRGHNQRFVSSPDYVRLPQTTEQVVDALQEAVDSSRRVSVRSGGHCYEDFVDNADVQAIIDMSDMTGVAFDERRGAIIAQPGALLGDVYYTLYKRWGVTLPGGSCYPVGLGGHVTGAGYGQLSRLHGLIVDHLDAVEVVTVDRSGRARAIVATSNPSDPHRDLWWAHTGGGGGNFGIVTRFWFRSRDAHGRDPRTLLPAPPAEVWIARATWSWDDMTLRRFTRLMENYGSWHEHNSAAGSPYAGLFARLEPTTRATGPFSMIVQIDAGVPGAEQRLRRFIAAVNEGVGTEPSIDEYRRLPWLHSTGWPGLWASNPTDRYEYKSSYHRRGFTRSQIHAFYKALSETDYAPSSWIVSIASYGGQVNTVHPQATAEPHRDSVLKLLWGTAWTDPAHDGLHIGWFRDVYRAVYADSGGVPVSNHVTDGCFINYADTDLSDETLNTSGVPWYELYYKGGYARLQRIKARWDPLDVFRHAQSVRLPRQ